MTLRMWADVTTRWTLGIAVAAEVSIRRIRPCGTVLRQIFAHNMPGRRRLWMYSAEPVTLARASIRGSERPICPEGRRGGSLTPLLQRSPGARLAADKP